MKNGSLPAGGREEKEKLKDFAIGNQKSAF